MQEDGWGWQERGGRVWEGGHIEDTSYLMMGTDRLAREKRGRYLSQVRPPAVVLLVRGKYICIYIYIYNIARSVCVFVRERERDCVCARARVHPSVRPPKSTISSIIAEDKYAVLYNTHRVVTTIHTIHHLACTRTSVTDACRISLWPKHYLNPTKTLPEP